MVGHRWAAHEQYERLVALLSEWLKEGIDWENWSIPRTAPIPTDGSDVATESAIDARLRALADRRGVLLVAARAGISFGPICQHEIRGARLLGIPVVVARPMDVNKSTFAVDRADKICSWRGEAVARAVAEMGRRPYLIALINRRAGTSPSPNALAAYAYIRRKPRLGLAARTLLEGRDD